MKRIWNSIDKEQRNIIGISGILLIFTSLLFLIISLMTKLYYGFDLAYLMGGVVSIFCFFLLSYKMNQSVDAMLKKTVGRIHSINLIIYILTMIGLFYLFNQSKWIIVCTIVAYLIPKMVIIFKQVGK